MKTYIALLRGINVSGQKKIKMADLRALLEKAGLENVRTYIQSGNVVFEHREGEAENLATKIQQAIRKKYGFEVPTLIITAEGLNYVLQNNPFLQQPDKDVSRMYVTFLAHLPQASQQEALESIDYAPEECRIDGKYVFLHSPNGYGRAKLNNNFLEQKLKVQATTRNWKTVNILYQMTVK